MSRPSAPPRSLRATRTRACRPQWAGSRPTPTGRRKSAIPVVEIARAEHQAEALEGLERWKVRHPEVVPFLEAPDILVDSMRGRSTTWTRVRVNLIHVPEADRPAQEALESDFDPWAGMDIEAWKAATAGPWARQARTEGETGGSNDRTGNEVDGRVGARRPSLKPEELTAGGRPSRRPRSCV